MKLRLSAALLVFAAALWTSQSSVIRSQAQTTGEEEFQGRRAVAQEVLVRVRPGAALGPLHSLTDAADSALIGSRGWRRIRSTSRLVSELIARLRGRSDVLDVEPNYIVQATTTVPNDPMFGNLWGLLNAAHPGADVHVTSAWDIVTGATANVIGVVDSGVDYTHPDLAANMWSAPDDFTITVGGHGITCLKGSHGFNAILLTCDPKDDYFHGTHVAGTIGAVGNNAYGAVGVNWSTRIMALKFLAANGVGSTADAVNAIDFAIKSKAYFAAHGGGANVRVLSNSWGGGAFSTSLRDEITAAGDADMLFVAAAGNATSNNDTTPTYPASYPQDNIITVAATDEADGLASFSNYGAKSVDLAAPGNNIYSTVPGGGFGTASGTSMATPHVSGAAMLILSACGLNTADLKKAILNNVDQLASLTALMVTGGRLNVDRAVRSCATVPTVSLTSPADGATSAAPATISFAATASDVDGIGRIEYYAAGFAANLPRDESPVLVASSSSAPFGATWTNVPMGSYTFTAKAYDIYGAYKVSSPAHVTVTGNAAASFLGADTTSQGNWIGARGFDGAVIANDSSRLPPLVTMTTAAPATTWAASTTDVRALWKSSATSRIAAAWSAATVSLDVNIADGLQHQVLLYLLDWDNLGRVERVDVRDASTNALLDTRTASGFTSGTYLQWVMQGHVRIDVVSTSGPNAVVSGVFFGAAGGNAPPQVLLSAPTQGASYNAPATISLSAHAWDTWGYGISRVEFYQGTTLLATSTNGKDDGSVNYTATWTGVAPGTYGLIAKAYEKLTDWPTAMSTPVQVTVTGPSSSATFQATDATTKGSWKGVFGSDGAVVVNDSTALPAYATLTTSAGNWTWAASTSDVRALQKKAGTDRIAATWYAAGTAAVDVNLTDGAPHRVSLYLVDWDGMGRTERVEVRDAASNALLDSRTVSSFVGGTYLTWTIQGHVVVNVVNVAGVNAVVSGVFFDTGGSSNAAPMVTLTTPSEGTSYTAPASIALAATASDSDGITKVEFYQGATLVATSVNGRGDGTLPYTATWSNVAAGNYTLTAKAYDASSSALSTVSDPVHVTVTTPGATTSATFFSIDTTTAGTWKGTYGADGAVIVNDSTTLPPYATLTTTAPNWTWAGSSADPRALQKSAGADRIAATWYGYTMAFDVNVIDGAPHRVSVYLVDWDNGGRVERVEVRDASTNGLLDSRTVSGFGGGQYLTWTIQGHVTINAIDVGGVNAVASGVFFDTGGGTSNAAPVVTLTTPGDGASYTAPASIALAATASDSDGINRVEFYQGSTLVATSVNGHGDGTLPYTATWSTVPAGNYTLTAKAVDASSSALSTVSGPVHVTVTTAGGSTSAVFVGMDATTQGAWRGTFGVDGAIVVNDSTRLPTYATATTTAPNWTWAASTSDVRALQKSAGTDRIAATWYGYTMGFDVSVIDGAPHRVSLYLIDWDNGGRVERVEVHDASTNALLDSRTVSGFGGGQYLTWTMQGHVTINVVYVSGTNAVASGLFFEP